MTRMIPIALAVIAALAAAAFAWQQHQALGRAQVALAGAEAQLQKARAELKAAAAEAAALRRDAAAHKAELDQQRAELQAARTFLESERAATARVREELAVAKEQIAFMSRSRPSQPASAAPPYAVPMLVRPPPAAVRVAPSGQPTSVGVGVRAQ